MCVIAIVESKRPSEEMVRNMWQKNPDGGGIAWLDEVDGEQVVRWKKGLDLIQMQQLCKQLPMPYVAHFRVASVGGVCKELTHPFCVDDFDKAIQLEGSSKGTVMFHNGHVQNWHELALRAVERTGVKIPIGRRWSDSRAMAWLTNLYGPGWLEFLNEKTVLFGPNVLEMFWGGGWKLVDDIWCSNDYFEFRGYYHGGHQHQQGHYSMCRDRRCTEKEGLDKDGYCVKHRAVTTVFDARQKEKGTTGVASPLTPFQLRNQLAQAEKQFEEKKAGKRTSQEMTFTKQELKRLRKAVLALPPAPAPLVKH